MLRFASLSAARTLVALTPLRRPAIATRSGGSTRPPFAQITTKATSSATLTVAATSDALTSGWFGRSRRLSSSSFPPEIFRTEDEILQFMQGCHEKHTDYSRQLMITCGTGSRRSKPFRKLSRVKASLVAASIMLAKVKFLLLRTAVLSAQITCACS